MTAPESTEPGSIVRSTLVPHAAFESAAKRLEVALLKARGGMDPLCLAVLGDSGTGKSRLLTEIWLEHPESRNEEGKIIPVLRVCTPSKPTPNSLAQQILLGLGDPRWNHGTEGVKTERVKVMLRETQVRMLMINEFQHFVDQGSHRVMHHVADWLKTLVEESSEKGWSLALVVAGLPSSISVVEQNEQWQRRFGQPIILPRFDWTNDVQREEFIAILEAFHEAMTGYFDLPQLHSESMAFLFYCASGGLIGYVVKILEESESKASEGGRRVITLQDIADAYEDAVWNTGLPDRMTNPFRDAKRYQPADEALMARIKEIGVKKEPS